LRNGSALARYTFLLTCFRISGIAHIIADPDNGISYNDSGAFRFFIMQAVGIMFEDAIQAIYRSIRGLRWTDIRRPNVWERLLGYFWVFVFMVWTTPSWSYASMAGSKGGSILPFSILSHFLRK
jgi:hypothetical protein